MGWGDGDAGRRGGGVRGAGGMGMWPQKLEMGLQTWWGHPEWPLSPGLCGLVSLAAPPWAFLPCL